MRHLTVCALLPAAFLFAFPSGNAIGAPGKDKTQNGSASDFPDNFDNDALFVAHLRIGDIWSSILSKEALEKVAAVKGGLEGLLDIEKTFRSRHGFWPGDFESATIHVAEFSEKDQRPLFILILKSAKPIDRKKFLPGEQRGNSMRKGFIALDRNDGHLLLHYLDDRTAVLVDELLADRYLAGYAKDRTGWPMNRSLLKAIEHNTLIAVMNTGRIPADIRRDIDKQAPGLGAARQFILAGNWKANELKLELRGSFPDEDSAKKARGESTKLLGEIAESVAKTAKDKRTILDMGAAIVLLTELQRAVSEAKIEQFGADLVAKTTYKVDLPLEKIAVELAEKHRIEALRGPSRNNLKLFGEAIQNYASANGGDLLIVWGTDAKGAPVKDLKAKPLLSWRVALLPYLGEDEARLYGQFKFDEPWDSAHNKMLISKMPKAFAPVNNVKAAEGHTFYQMVIGPKAMRPGAFNIGNIIDGTMNTIAVVEAAEPVIWTKPEDVFIPGERMPNDLKKKFGGLYKDGFNVLMYDGSVRWVDTRKVSDSTLWIAIRPDDRMPMPSDWDD